MSRILSFPTRRVAPALSLALAAAMSAFTVPAHATGDVFYSGRATGVNATVTVLGIRQSVTIADNGMSCQGQAKSETLYSLSNPAPLGIWVNEAYTFTQGRERRSLTKARLSGLKLDVPGLALDGSLIEARAQATCDASNTVALAGKSTVGTLTVNGKGYAVTGAPNQTISIPGIASIVVNEQRRYSNEIRVTGVHVKLLTSNTLATGGVKLAAARARIVCE